MTLLAIVKGKGKGKGSGGAGASLSKAGQGEQGSGSAGSAASSQTNAARRLGFFMKPFSDRVEVRDARRAFLLSNPMLAVRQLLIANCLRVHLI